ncbi:MAG TPA: hypothetical protein VFG28_05105 [Syntrophales bacterium]|nr:hypothetical protein [Syntrophales bacterium]
MSFVVQKKDEKRYALLAFKGGVTISELEESRRALKDIALASNGYRKIIVDMQEASLAASTLDIHQFFASNKVEPPTACLIAVVVNPNNWADALFAENVARNHGICLRVFRNDFHARAWLGISDSH